MTLWLELFCQFGATGRTEIGEWNVDRGSDEFTICAEILVGQDVTLPLPLHS